MRLARTHTALTRVCASVCLCFVIGLTGAAESSRTLDRIKAEGAIRLGYRSGAAPFSFKERDGSVRGYSAELCTRIAASVQKRIGLTSLRIDWVPLDAADRLEAVAERSVDMGVGAQTNSLSPHTTGDFSLPTVIYVCDELASHV